MLIFLQASMLLHGTSCVGTIFRALTQNHKCALSICSKHMIINNNKQKTNMETTIRRSHRMNYSLFIQGSSRSIVVSSKAHGIETCYFVAPQKIVSHRDQLCWACNLGHRCLKGLGLLQLQQNLIKRHHSICHL